MKLPKWPLVVFAVCFIICAVALNRESLLIKEVVTHSREIVGLHDGQHYEENEDVHINERMRSLADTVAYLSGKAQRARVAADLSAVGMLLSSGLFVGQVFKHRKNKQSPPHG